MPFALESRITFGHRAGVYKNVHYITDTDIVYPSGAILVFQNLVTNKQKYLALPDQGAELKTLLVSPQKSLVAVLINAPQKPQIHIFDSTTMKRLRTLSLPPESTAKTMESMNFSFDERFVVVITGEPDWMMLVYNWERGKIESSTKANYLTNPSAPVREVVCSPVDCSILAIYGTGMFRLMNMQETVWRQYGFQKAENFDICSCCFLGGDRILCGTKDGLLLLVDLGELKFVFDADVVNYINARADKEEEFLGAVTSATLLERQQAPPREEQAKTDRGVRALTALKNGFAYSCLPGLVHFFEKISAHKYKKRNVYEITDKDFRENQTRSILTVKHLASDVSEKNMIATTRRSQLYWVQLWGPEMDIAGKVPFKHLWYSLHTGPVGDLALCYWKPIFMTFGTIDRTVRIWNYVTDRLEMMKQYQEDVHSISLHPTGLYAAIGFSDKLRFMTILIDDFHVSREFPIRDCPRSSFNMSGNLLVAVNRHVIQIYSVTTFQNLANLKGHSGLITSLQWTSDDKKLISCGTDGSIYEWNMESFKRVGETVNKGITYWDCAVMSNGKNIYTVGSDDYLKEIRASNILRMINLHETGMNHVVISRSNTFMFISGFKGWILAVKLPIEEPPDVTKFSVHNTCVTQIRLTLDDQNLITCTRGGMICIWSLPDVEGFFPDKQFKFFTEILISKNDLEEKLSSIKDLTQRTYELEMEHAYQIRHMETVYGEKIKDINDTYAQAIEELKGILEVIETNHNTELNNISSDINVMKERHEARMLETEAEYNSELIVEYDKVRKLELLKGEVTEMYEKKLAELQESKEKTIEELKRINESKLYNLNKMLEEARDDIEKEVKQHDELTHQIEDDNDSEIENVKSKYEKTLKNARESNIRLKGESGVLKKKIITCQKEIELIQMEIINLTAEHEKFKLSIRNLEQDILDLKKEITERDLRIQDKEKRIYDLKRKDQEYERYKFVLNYRIKELKNQIEPRDKEMKEKKEQIAEMEVELEELQKVNISLENNLSERREKLNDVYKLLHVYKRKYNLGMSLVNRVKTDIYTASGNIQDYKKLKDSVKKLYFKYIPIGDKEFAKARRGDQECIAELQRQKLYLQGIVEDLQKNVEKNKQVHYGAGMTYMNVNWTLMEEITKIRKKMKIAESKVNDMKTILCVRLTKIYSPREAHRLIQRALQSEEELREECEVKMEEATSKAVAMKEELDTLLYRISVLEGLVAATGGSKKKRKDPLQFRIPTII